MAKCPKCKGTGFYYLQLPDGVGSPNKVVCECKELVQLDEDQSVPENPAWHKNEREFEAYCAGRNDMLRAGFRKVK